MELPHFKSLTILDLDEAMRLTQNWVQYQSLDSTNPPVETGYKRAFWVAREDLIALAQQRNFNGIRIYFGKDSTDALSDMRLVLVSVDDHGNDVTHEVNGVAPVYDFSMPCPDTCDPTSPLYTGHRRRLIK